MSQGNNTWNTYLVGEYLDADAIWFEKFIDKVEGDIFEQNLNYKLALQIWERGLKEFNRRD